MQPPTWLWGTQGRKLVVLGADGFIGSWVVRLGLAAGARVVGLCVKQPWRLAGIVDSRLRLEAVPGGRWWDSAQLEGLASAMGGGGTLVHLGYEPPPAGLGLAQRVEHELAVNAASAGRIAEAAADGGGRVIFASSADVYGPWHDDPVDERTSPNPVTPYAEAKLVAEGLVLRTPGARCLRIGTVFGPGELGSRAIPSFVRAIVRGRPATLHGEGLDVRDYVGVPEVAAAIVNATAPASMFEGPRLLNVGTGVGRTTRSVLETVAAALGVEPSTRCVPSTRMPSRLVINADAARKAVGFATDPRFAEAVAREAQWLLDQRQRWPE